MAGKQPKSSSHRPAPARDPAALDGGARPGRGRRAGERLMPDDDDAPARASKRREPKSRSQTGSSRCWGYAGGWSPVAFRVTAIGSMVGTKGASLPGFLVAWLNDAWGGLRGSYPSVPFGKIASRSQGHPALKLGLRLLSLKVPAAESANPVAWLRGVIAAKPPPGSMVDW